MYATAYIVFTIAISALCYVTCVSPFTFFEKKIWNYFTGKKREEESREKAKTKRKDSKPAIVDIGHIKTSKYIENLKLKLDHTVETKSFQT